MALKDMAFFCLSDPVANRPFRGSVNADDSWRRIRGDIPSNGAPLVVTYLSGGDLQDFIWTDTLVPLVNCRVLEILRPFTGWRTYEVVISNKSGGIVAGYQGLSIVGRCQSISFSSEVRGQTRGGSPYVQGLTFALDSWDGSDLFMDASGTLWILGTETVARAFKKHKVTNCRIRLIDEITMLASGVPQLR
jgi:hypothetical protein